MSSSCGTGEGTAPNDGRLWLVFVLVAFVLSRAVLYSLGIRFNTEGLIWYWQILDPELLRTDPVGSVLWMHVQPPLFNLILALVLVLFSSAAPAVLNGLFLLLGGTMVVVLYRLVLEVGWSARPAALLVTALMLTPGWVMYESWMFYDFPTALLLALAVLALVRFGRGASFGWLLVFVWSIGGLALLRSLFHLVWLAAAASVVLICQVGIPRKRLVLFMLPLLLVTGLYVKNLVLFGFFGPSSWLGMSVSKMTTTRLDHSERERMVTGGALSGYTLVPPFSPLESYEDAAGISFVDGERPVLGLRLKSTGQPNLNHQAYVSVSKALGADAATVLMRRPEVYIRAVGQAWRRFFSPVVAYPPFEENLLVIAPLFSVSQATFGRPWVSVGTYCTAVFLLGIVWRRARTLGDRGLEAAAVFVLLNLAWVAVVGNCLEVGENHRFRFVLTPLIWFSLSAGVAPLLFKRPDPPPRQ